MSRKIESPHTHAVVKDLKDFRSSALLIGTKGLTMMEDANDIASFLLETDHLSSHPDFMFITKKEGEKTIGVDIADMIVKRSNVFPNIAKKTVVIIDAFNEMTVQAQNKLLKVLEESSTLIIIGIAYEDTLLPTIKSRMRCIYYQPLPFDAYQEQFVKSGNQTANVLAHYYASGGILGANPPDEVIRIFAKVKEAFLTGVPHLAFLHYNMVKEKDPNAFFVAHRAYVGPALSFMGAVITGLYEKNKIANYGKAVQLLAANRNSCNSLSYTKDSFFACLSQVVERIGTRDDERG